MTITYVSGQEETTVPTSSPHDVAIDTGTRTNGLLVTTIYCLGASVITAFAVSYAGQAMTELIDYNPSGNIHLYLYFIEAPDDGSDTLSVTYTVQGGAGWLRFYHISSWYDGADQTAAEDQSNSGTGATDPSLTITPTENDELIVSLYQSNANDVLTPTSPHTLIHDEDFGGIVAGGGYTIQTTASEETVAWTGADETWYMVLGSFKAAAAAASAIGPFPTFLH